MSNDLIPTEQEFKMLENMSVCASQSKFFDRVGSQGGLLSIMVYAKELGLPPMQCLFGGMHNIQGKIELSASLMNAMIRKAGHMIEILQCDNNTCSLKGTRKDTKETYTETFTMQDAQQADLMKNPTYKKFPKNMLFARALKNLSRMLFSDVIGSAYVEGEISDLDDKKKTFEAKPKEEIATIEATIVEEAPTVVEKQSIVVEKQSIVVEDSHVEFIQKVSGIEDKENLKLYFTKCATQFKKTPEELMEKWTIDPEHLKKNFSKWLEKQQPDNSKF